MDAIKASWKGNERLWKVFWIYNWLFGAAFDLAWKAAEPRLPIAAEVVLALLGLVWGVWVIVSLWRCAFNASWRPWGYIARGLVVVSVLAGILVVGAGFFGDEVA